MNVKQKVEELRRSPEAVAFKAAREDWYKAHPDVPRTKDIPVLNLIMKREFAEAILAGEKTIEFRAFSDHYYERLYDKNVNAYAEAHEDDEELARAIDEGYVDSLRNVLKIHFHNYSNTWFLDCECLLNDEVAVVPDDVAYLNEMYDCHELDAMLGDLTRKKEANRPIFFYFVLGDVLDTNLK